jgi:hypothetical protein
VYNPGPPELFIKDDFLRGIAEYKYFYKSLRTDFVLSFTYVPGTVVQLGYGSDYEKMFWNNQRYLASDSFFSNNKRVFH